MTRDEVIDHFSYRPVLKEDLPRCEAITEATKACALTIYDNTPGGPEQTLAIRALEEARMRANQAIAFKNKG